MINGMKKVLISFPEDILIFKTTKLKIISKFKDYYDYGSSFGIDETKIFHRKTFEFEISKAQRNKLSFLRRSYSYLRGDFRLIVLGFCGNYYFGIRNNEKIWWGEDKILNHYIVEKRNNNFDWEFEKFNLIDTNSWISGYRKRNLDELKSNLQKINFFDKIDDPYFYLDRKNCIVNPSLKELKFQSLKDSVQAFQEIEMFISFEKQVNIPTGSDDVIRDSKGFDKKYSFRKRPKK